MMNCVVCGTNFTKSMPNQKCCSSKCSFKNKKLRIAKYIASEHYSLIRKKHDSKYLSNPNYKKKRKEYLSRPEVRKALNLRRKAYSKTPAQQLYRKEHNKYSVRKEQICAYMKHRKANDFLFKLKYSITNAINRNLKNIGVKKDFSCEKILGYNLEQLKVHLEKQFDSAMSWSNYGSYWEIDHVVPISWFKTKDQQIKKGWALRNLQPLEKKLNLEKHNHYVGNPKTKLGVILC